MEAVSDAKELFDKRVQAWEEADKRLEVVLEHRFGHPCWVNRSEDGGGRRPVLLEIVVQASPETVR